MPKTILIAGASVRGAVDSAIRGGWRPVAADLFNDQDLQQQCQTYRIADYPGQLLAISQQIPAMPWIYTGGLENHHQLVEQVSQRHQLWGNPAPVLEQCSDPFLMRQILTDEDLLFPEIQTDRPHKTPCRWLQKSTTSTGGNGVQWAEEAIPNQGSSPGPETYFQQYIPGISCSGLFLAKKTTSQLVGVTRQIIGKRFTSGKHFSYAGSIGPLTLTIEQQATIARIGTVLTTALDLQGLFGVDFICQQNKVWVLEINPRFPASAEILDHAFGISLVDLHCLACQDNPTPELSSGHNQLQWGKAILYARRPCTISAQCSHTWLQQTSRPASHASEYGFYLADIPAAGTTITTGSPILSIVTWGTQRAQVQRQLIRAAKQVRQQCNA